MKITSGTFRLDVDLKEREAGVLTDILNLVTAAMRCNEVAPLNKETLVEKVTESIATHVSKAIPLPSVEVKVEPTKEDGVVKVEVVAPAPVVEAPKEVAKPKAEKPKEEVKEEEQPPRRFMIGKCKCGEMHYLFVYDNGRPYDYNCRKCGTSYQADYHTLVQVQTECECGGASTFFITPDSTVKKAECRRCGLPNTIVKPKKVLTYR